MTGGFCLRAPAQGACAYANICEHCPAFHTEPETLPALAAQRADTQALVRDADDCGWTSEAERHARLIARLDQLISRPSTMTRTSALSQVDRACAQLRPDGKTITFTAIAASTGLSRTTLYRNPDLRALIDNHKHHAAASGTITTLADEVATLRAALDTVAARVRHHEEQLRKLAARIS